MLAVSSATETIDARFASAENIELGEAVERLVAAAPVTESFKGFIAHTVREAHAWESKVDDIVSPEQLGLLSGDGIFDPAQAKDIEAQTLRGQMFDVMRRYTYVASIEGEDTMVLPPPPQLFLRPPMRPDDYKEAVRTMDDWSKDYQDTYGDDPFEGLDGGAFMYDREKLIVPRDTSLAQYIDRLRQLQYGTPGEGEQV